MAKQEYIAISGKQVPVISPEDLGRDEVRSGQIVYEVDASFDHEFGTERRWEWEFDSSTITIQWADRGVWLPEHPIRHTYETDEEALWGGGTCDVVLKPEVIVITRVNDDDGKEAYLYVGTFEPVEAKP